MLAVSGFSPPMLLRIVVSCLILCVLPVVLIRMRQLGWSFRIGFPLPLSAGGSLFFSILSCCSNRLVICANVFNLALGLSHNICYVSRFPSFLRSLPR